MLLPCRSKRKSKGRPRSRRSCCAPGPEERSVIGVEPEAAQWVNPVVITQHHMHARQLDMTDAVQRCRQLTQLLRLRARPLGPHGWRESDRHLSERFHTSHLWGSKSLLGYGLGFTRISEPKLCLKCLSPHWLGRQAASTLAELGATCESSMQINKILSPT